VAGGGDCSGNINNLSVAAVVQRDPADDDAWKHVWHYQGCCDRVGCCHSVRPCVHAHCAHCKNIWHHVYCFFVALGVCFGIVKGVATASVAATTVRPCVHAHCEYVWHCVYVWHKVLFFLGTTKGVANASIAARTSALVCMLTAHAVSKFLCHSINIVPCIRVCHMRHISLM